MPHIRATPAAIAVLLLGLVAATAVSAAPRPRGSSVLPGVHRLDSTTPGSAAKDLEPLRKLVGKASVVGLGESIHTSGGYYQMKHRVFRFLVERMGFRALAIESPWVPVEQAARFVESCGGSADDAARTLLDVWQSGETRDLLQWMCDWNRAHARPQDRVHLFGFDVQDFQGHVHIVGSGLLAFLGRLGIVAPDPRAAGILQCARVDEGVPSPAPIPDSSYQACLGALDAVDQLFSGSAAEIARQTSAADLAAARIDALSLRAWEDAIYFAGRDRKLSFEARDQGMADVFLALRNLLYPKVKTALWAANVHVARNWDAATGELSMGTHLGRRLGRDYVPIALAGYDVGVDWGPLDRTLCGVKPYHEDDALETRLHGLGQPYLFVDLKFPGSRPPFLQPGAPYRVGDDLLVPQTHFDALIFLDRSPAMSPLAWPPCTG